MVYIWYGLVLSSFNGWLGFNSMINVTMIQLVEWLSFRFNIQFIIEFNYGCGSSLTIWWKVAYTFDALSEVDPVWNIVKCGPRGAKGWSLQ